MAVVSAILLAFLAVLNWFRFRDVRYPALLHASIWCAISVLLSLPFKMLDVASNTVLILIVLSSISFSVGAWAATYEHKPMFALAQIKRQSLPPNALLVALIVIVAAVVPLWV